MMTETAKPDEAFVVDRTLRVREISGSEEVARIREQLQGLDGMLKVELDTGRSRLRLRYDASRLGFAQIEAALREIGCVLAPGLWWRTKATLYRYMDENARENAGHRPAACCSNPADIYARKHK